MLARAGLLKLGVKFFNSVEIAITASSQIGPRCPHGSSISAISHTVDTCNDESIDRTIPVISADEENQVQVIDITSHEGSTTEQHVEAASKNSILPV